MAIIQALPTEVLELVVSFLDKEPPSEAQVYEEPSLALVESGSKPLKNLSTCCQSLRNVTVKLLFSHIKAGLGLAPQDLKDILSRYHLSKIPIRSLLVHDLDNGGALPNDLAIYGRAYIMQVRQLFGYCIDMLDPMILTLALHPLALGELTDSRVSMVYSWASWMQYQTLCHERDPLQTFHTAVHDILQSS